MPDHPQCPYDFACKVSSLYPEPLILNPLQQMSGPKTKWARFIVAAPVLRPPPQDRTLEVVAPFAPSNNGATTPAGSIGIRNLYVDDAAPAYQEARFSIC